MMAERVGVEVDYCPKCRGVWLDRGELDKILARAAAEFEDTKPVEREVDRGTERVTERSRQDQLEELLPPPPRRRDDDDDDWKHHDKRRRKKRFNLGDIFDF